MPRRWWSGATYTATSAAHRYAARERCSVAYAYPETVPSCSATSHGYRSARRPIRSAISAASGARSSNDATESSTYGAYTAAQAAPSRAGSACRMTTTTM